VDRGPEEIRPSRNSGQRSDKLVEYLAQITSIPATPGPRSLPGATNVLRRSPSSESFDRKKHGRRTSSAILNSSTAIIVSNSTRPR